MWDDELVVMKDVIMGVTTYHLVRPKEVGAYMRCGFSMVTKELPPEQAEAILKLLED